ncbi:hypothetical protein [Roseateles sp. LKC17W]|uniref:Polysaccharide chain length determinant N-terminal domain-containing protein n=1 Tax=Pelomonas margarita TaxID=3299031 RepID=A0ABW7FPK1_9BURK
MTPLLPRPAWRFALALVMLPLLGALLTALGCLLLIAPVYTARVSVAVQAPPARLPMYGALLQSRSMAERVIDHFALQALWGERSRTDTRERLAESVRVGSNRGGLLIVEVDAPLPWLAADMAGFHLLALQDMLDQLRRAGATERRQRLAAALHEAQAAAARARETLARSGIDEASLRSDRPYAMAQWLQLSHALQQAQARLARVATRYAPGSAPYGTEAALVAALEQQLQGLQAARPPAAAGYAAAWREHQRLERLLLRLRLADQQLQQDAERREETLAVVDRPALPERAGRPGALALIGASWALCTAGLLAWRRRGRR